MISLVITTCKNNREAEKLSNMLLKKKLSACVKNQKIKSSYWWKGKIEKSNEILLTAVVNKSKVESVMEAIRKNHSYEVPEIIEVPVGRAGESYWRWVLSVE